MVTLILYAFATGVRSSRAIERQCRENVAYRVITGNLVPDHVTVSRFICRHEHALSGLFSEVLKLCDRAGLVKPGVVSIDGTRMAGNASPEVNFEFEQIAREVVAQSDQFSVMPRPLRWWSAVGSAGAQDIHAGRFTPGLWL